MEFYIWMNLHLQTKRKQKGEHHLLLEHTEMRLSVQEMFVCMYVLEKETHNDVIVLWLSGQVCHSVMKEH